MIDELTLDQCRRFLRLKGPTGPGIEGWELDFWSIDKALDILQIDHEVQITFTTGVYSFGSHTIFHAEIHIIRMSQVRDIDDANLTLWHELVHASQAEEYARVTGNSIRDFYKLYSQSYGPKGSMYQNNKFEIQARELSNKYSHIKLLRY